MTQNVRVRLLAVSLFIIWGCGQKKEYEHVVYPDSYQPRPADSRKLELPAWRFAEPAPPPIRPETPVVAKSDEWINVRGQILSDDDASKRGTALLLIYRIKEDGSHQIFESDGSGFDFREVGRQKYSFFVQAPRKKGVYQLTVYRSAEKLTPLFDTELHVR